MSSRLTRRDFLLYSGATAAGVTLGEFGRRQLARADARAHAWRPVSAERWTTSVCRGCSAACGVRVRLVDDVPVKLEGNPLCPISRGRLCAKGQASIETYFDPDRLTGPARRAGTGRDGRWERIEWDAAIATVAARLQSSAARPGQVLALAADERGPMADAWARFWSAAGARVVATPSATATRLRDPFCAVTGVDSSPLFDLENATYVLSFGAPIVEDWLSAVWTQRSYGRFRRGAPHSRGRLVQIDSRRSMTARKADEWLSVPLDSQLTLAYGIAAVLLREGRTTRGAADAPNGNISAFERGVAADYMADHVAAATGVPVVTVLRLARDLVASPRPLVAVAADAPSALVEAVMSLNALIGAFDRPGGVFAATGSQPPPVDIGDPPHTASGPVRLVALRDASMLRSLSTPAALIETVQQAEFVVSFSPYLDEAAEAADLLLPMHTPLESWQAVIPSTVLRGEQIALARPSAAARLDTRDAAAILKTIATAVGGPVAAACTWTTSGDLVNTELGRLGRERRGMPYASPYETQWTEQLEHGGWWIPPTSAPETFAAAVLDSGGWIDPAFEPGEILNALESRGGPSFVVPAAAAVAPAEQAEPDRAEYPLRATAFTPAVIDMAAGQNQPALFELLGQPDGLAWQPWIEVRPDAAHALGIEQASRVRVTSPFGTMEAIAVLADGVSAGCAAIAHVPFVPGGGRWARTSESDVRRLWPRGEPAVGTVPVRLARV